MSVYGYRSPLVELFHFGQGQIRQGLDIREDGLLLFLLPNFDHESHAVQRLVSVMLFCRLVPDNPLVPLIQFVENLG